jgi:hypothetical protein
LPARVLGAAVLVASAVIAVAPSASASVGFGLIPTFPTNVAVGQAGLPASIQIVNTSTSTESTGNVTINAINLVPACASVAFVGSGDCPVGSADPGVFALSPMGVGEAGTACTGQTFTITIIDPATGQYTFTPTGGLVVLSSPGTASSACVIDFTFNVLKVPSKDSAPASPGLQTAQIEFATGTSSVNGAMGSGVGSSSTTVTQASPSISTQASAGGPVGTAVTDTATVAGGLSPTGTVTFRLFTSNACTTQVGATSTKSLASGSATSDPFTPTSPGTYYWTAVYGGDANNNPATSACNAPNESVTITKASPIISTQASPGNLLGAPVRDVATLAGGLSPTGTVTFRLFSDNSCATQVFTSTNPLSGASATSDWFTPATSGTYWWMAAYSGDANNNGATSACQAANEAVVIAPFVAPAPTRTISGDLVGPVTVNAGESVLITNARVVGPITVNPGGALSVVNSQISRGIAANAPSFLSLCGAQVSGPSPGVALSVSNAAVPIRIGDPANGCAGNRFAGDVTLTSNVAVTFGANTVSGNVTANNDGPGNTVLKANTIFGALGCAGNAPPPTNAGQANTAGSKTGQCVGV